MASSEPWATHAAVKREKQFMFPQSTFRFPDIENEWRGHLTGSTPKTLPLVHLISPRSLFSSPKPCPPLQGHASGHDPSSQSKRFVLGAVCHLSPVADVTTNENNPAVFKTTAAEMLTTGGVTVSYLRDDVFSPNKRTQRAGPTTQRWLLDNELRARPVHWSQLSLIPRNAHPRTMPPH